MANITPSRCSAFSSIYAKNPPLRFGSLPTDLVSPSNKEADPTQQAFTKPKKASPLAAVSVLSLILSLVSGGGLWGLWQQQKTTDAKHKKEIDALTLSYGTELTRLKKANKNQAEAIAKIENNLSQEQKTNHSMANRLREEQNIDLGQSRTLLQHGQKLNKLAQTKPELTDVIAKRLPSNVTISTTIKSEIAIIKLVPGPDGNSIEDPAGPENIIEQKSQLIGSGIWLQAKDGNVYILTNYHVIDGDTSDSDHPDSPYTITPYSSSDMELKKTHQATLVKGSEELDLALLKIQGPFRLSGQIAPLKIRNTENKPLLAGEQVFTIGAPAGLKDQVSIGNVSHPNRFIADNLYLMTDTAINSGNSGGGLYDAEGHLIGIVTFKLTDVEGVSAAIPIERVIEWLKTLHIEIKQK